MKLMGRTTEKTQHLFCYKNDLQSFKNVFASQPVVEYEKWEEGDEPDEGGDDGGDIGTGEEGGEEEAERHGGQAIQ